MCQGTTTHIIDGNQVVLEEGDLLFSQPECGAGDSSGKGDGYCGEFYHFAGVFQHGVCNDGEEDNALKEFLVGTLCRKNELASYLYFHVSKILPIQNLIENMVWTIFYDMANNAKL